jgi:hypothetical protein
MNFSIVVFLLAANFTQIKAFRGTHIRACEHVREAGNFWELPWDILDFDFSGIPAMYELVSTNQLLAHATQKDVSRVQDTPKNLYSAL